MTLTAHKDPALQDDFVDVKYREMTHEIQQIFGLCEKTNSILLCEKEGAIHRVDLHDILYIEWVDSRSCVYTNDDVYTIPLPLNRLEESLKERHFVRISKMCLVNLYKVKSVSNGLNFRLTAKISNGEEVVISRHYRGALLTVINELAREVLR